MNKNCSQKGFAAVFILLIGVLIGGVVVGAYYLGTQQRKEQNTQTQATPTPVSQTDETANWKTYDSKCFSIKYPQGWKIEDDTTNSDGVFKADCYAFLVASDFQYYGAGSQGASLEIAVIPFGQKYGSGPEEQVIDSVNSYIDTKKAFSDSQPVSEKTIGQYTGKKYLNVIPGRQIVFVFSKNDKLYVFKWKDQEDSGSIHSNDAETMISTFKFTQ